MAAEILKVLVVDDEETVGLLLQRILHSAGYDVITAANGEEALSIMASGDISIVLLDIKMPGLSGMDLLGRINSDLPDLCVIMVTAVADVQTAVAAMKLGAYDYITKPFDQVKMLDKIRQAIVRWQEHLQDKQQQVRLKQNIAEQTRWMQQQFNELVNSMAREHRLLQQLAAKQGRGGRPLLSGLPAELQKPIASVAEFREALLRILKKG